MSSATGVPAAADVHPDAQRVLAREQLQQRTPPWYEARRGLLTASDAAAALDIPPFKSYKGRPRAELLERKLANRPLRCMAVLHGQSLETEACDLMAERLGERVFEVGLLRHETLPWLAASPDGVTASGLCVEIKCPIKRRIEPGVVPHHYWPQVQVQMEVCDLDRTVFVQYKPARLSDTREPELDVAYVDRDRAWFARNKDALHAFWSEYMAARDTHVWEPEPPAPPCLVDDALYDDFEPAEYKPAEYTPPANLPATFFRTPPAAAEVPEAKRARTTTACLIRL